MGPTFLEEDVLIWAIAMFILGSVMFVFAAFLNALNLHRNVTFANWAVATCGIYELGGILFVMGSVCFMPNQGCGQGMEALGAWCFITGSLCYILGGLIELAKVVALLYLVQQQEEAVKRIERAALGWLNKRKATTTAVSANRRVSAPSTLQMFAPRSSHSFHVSRASDADVPLVKRRSASWIESVSAGGNELALSVQKPLEVRQRTRTRSEGDVFTPHRTISGDLVAGEKSGRSMSERSTLFHQQKVRSDRFRVDSNFSDSYALLSARKKSPELWSTFVLAVQSQHTQASPRRPGGSKNLFNSKSSRF